MKIEAFKGEKYSAYFFLGIMAMIVLSSIQSCIWLNDEEDYILVLCVLPFVIVWSYLFYIVRKSFAYVIWENKYIQSYSFFKRKLCEVDLNKPVYYIVFKIQNGRYMGRRYVAISNEPFQYQPVYGIAKMEFIYHYDWKKIIIVPYERQTILLVKFEEWQNIEELSAEKTEVI